MPWLALLTSVSTLICCVLPALLVSVGMGASLVTLLGDFPQLIVLSENKNLIFTVTALTISLAGLYIRKQKNAPCPVDPILRTACIHGRKWSFRAWVGSLVIFSVGTFVTYLIPIVMD